MVLNEINNGFDIPTEYTSSIGSAVWPPIETNNERLKGVYPNVIEDINQLSEFLQEFSSLNFSEKSSRITARAVIATKVLLEAATQSIPFIETIVPLAGCGIDILSDCALVYFGKNQPSRKTPPDILDQQYQLALKIYNEHQPPRKNIPEGFSIKPLEESERNNSRIIQMYNELYSLFGWSNEDIRRMLSNPQNLIFAAFDSTGKIVSSAIAEQGTMNFLKSNTAANLSLSEITEAATLPEFRGFGLYQAVSDGILYYLARMNPPPNLVFGELNLDAPSVLKVSARQGRIPAIVIAQQYNLPCSWFLEQHVVISHGDRLEKGKLPNYQYNNLMVAFLPQNLLLERYGK